METEVLIVWIVGLILGAIEVPIFQWLKNVLKLEGTGALLFVLFLSLLISFVAMLATGGYSPFDPNQLLTYLASTVTMSQVVYGLFLRK